MTDASMADCRTVGNLPNKRMSTLARRNLLVSAVNTARERRLIAFEPIGRGSDRVNEIVFEYTLGGYLILSHMCDHNWPDQICMRVTCRPTELGRTRIKWAVLHDFQIFGDATAFGWLEWDGEGGTSLDPGDYHGYDDVTEALGSMDVGLLDGPEYRNATDHVFRLTPRGRR